MTLSVITINRNNADGLRRTLESTFGKQTGFDDWEQIVVDGASTDGSVAVLDKWKDSPHLGWHVSEPDTGLYNAMNKGAAHARGDYLLFLNSGDELVDGILEKVFSTPFTADIVYGDLLFVDRNGHASVKTFPDASELSPTWFLFGWLPHPASFIFRSRLLDAGGYDEHLRIVSDAKFFTESACNPKVRFFHLPLTVSKFQPGGISGDPRHIELKCREIESFWKPIFGDTVARLAVHYRFELLNSYQAASRCLPAHVVVAANLDEKLAVCLRETSGAIARLWRFKLSRVLLRIFLFAPLHGLHAFRHRLSGSQKQPL